ncbi:hypothetical protein [Streptomyces sp. NPDC058441]|uniref:hypothetical protein n=1 Tax=Streptomyces sp. NPDC058441 TaxID=3346502 RepID=UPI00365953CF
MVVDFVRRTVELPEGTLPLCETGRTAERQRTEVRQRVGTKYKQCQARQIAEAAIRKESAAKNRPADLINIALEKVVAAGLELLAFSTFDTMASTIRTEVNTSICCGVHAWMSLTEQAGMLRLLEERDSDGTTQFNRLKQPAQGPSWSHFKRLFTHLEWLDEPGDTAVWVDGVAAPKVTDFAGEADAADASELRDYAAMKRIALLACLAHKARMRVRDDLATMFCKRVAMKIKKAREELEEIRLAERDIVEALIGNYRTVLKNLDDGGPAQEALAKAAAMTAEAVKAWTGWTRRHRWRKSPGAWAETSARPCSPWRRPSGCRPGAWGWSPRRWRASAGLRGSTSGSRRSPRITATSGRCCCAGSSAGTGR